MHSGAAAGAAHGGPSGDARGGLVSGARGLMVDVWRSALRLVWWPRGRVAARAQDDGRWRSLWAGSWRLLSTVVGRSAPGTRGETGNRPLAATLSQIFPRT